MQTIRIGTRGSQLALWQTAHITKLLSEAHPDLTIERVIIKTEGDRDQTSSLTQIGGQGVFTKAIEDALLENRVDVAIHSLKDLPSVMDESLLLGAVPKRESVCDSLVTLNQSTLAELPPHAKVATGSIRRQSQLLQLRPDIEICDLRGNIDTRLKKLDSQGFDGIIMAEAALQRLELGGVARTVFATDDMTPAVGQGAIGIQCRKIDANTLALLQAINKEDVFCAVTAERAVLSTLDTGCQFPVGAYASIDCETITINGYVGSEDGKTIIRDVISGSLPATNNQEQNRATAFALGKKLADKLIALGALELLSQHN